MHKLLFALTITMSLSGCVSPITLEEQTPDVAYQNTDKVLISVIDDRQRVKDGKPRDYIGTVHTSFGIPVDWHVKQVLATEEGDKDKDLSGWLEHRIVNGLNERGWNTEEANVKSSQSKEDATNLLTQHEAITLIQLTLEEWFFRINLNWVTAFNFDTDTTIDIYDVNQGLVLNKNFKERDVIEETASESPQNNILRAYRDQLQQIFRDPDIAKALDKKAP